MCSLRANGFASSMIELDLLSPSLSPKPVHLITDFESVVIIRLSEYLSGTRL
jgi:hypothetical protein